MPRTRQGKRAVAVPISLLRGTVGRIVMLVLMGLTVGTSEKS